MTDPIPFANLAAQRRRLGSKINDAIDRVIAHGRFILGPEVAELEQRLATFVGARHCIACANGTDALALALMAWGVKPGDAVFVPAFTFVATAEAVAWLGATPVFVDVRADTFNIDVGGLEAAIADARERGLRPRAVIAVDLFGQPADYSLLNSVAERHGMFVLADAAQSLGATLGGRCVGSLAPMTTTSFFPVKPLGCYGDGGALFTDSDDLAALIKSLRSHGSGTEKYDNVRIGLNSRLDTMQAAILLEKLEIFPDEIKARQRVAERYDALLGDLADTPVVIDTATSVWAAYTIKTGRRDHIVASLKENGISTAVYYPRPLNRQSGYACFPCVPGGVPVSEKLANTVLSLPIHPYLDAEAQDRIVSCIRNACATPGSKSG
ncbi:MAG: DegT/DnrJ/EryC1/StrS aminotransferase family protein [Proteobacteria bacterium]|nr:DegT/DnrJ/EryC1/StrS aminotransferase family protein [Pseudomonadota bacterium]